MFAGEGWGERGDPATAAETYLFWEAGQVLFVKICLLWLSLYKALIFAVPFFVRLFLSEKCQAFMPDNHHTDERREDSCRLQSFGRFSASPGSRSQRRILTCPTSSTETPPLVSSVFVMSSFPVSRVSWDPSPGNWSRKQFRLCSTRNPPGVHTS